MICYIVLAMVVTHARYMVSRWARAVALHLAVLGLVGQWEVAKLGALLLRTDLLSLRRNTQQRPPIPLSLTSSNITAPLSSPVSSIVAMRSILREA